MVNFDNDQTVATAPKQVLNMIFIEHYYNLIDSIEKYNEIALGGSPGNINKVRSRLNSLILCQYNAFKKTFDSDNNKELWIKLKDSTDYKKPMSVEEVFELVFMVLEWADEKGLIKVVEAKRDLTNPFEDNRVNGYT